MKKEYKELFMTDLCGRLSSHTIVEYHGSDVDLTDYARSVKLEECKPYLRPMSSMTEKEKEKYYNLIRNYEKSNFISRIGHNIFEFLYKHHFDYRGLILKGLALLAPEGMYKID